MLKIKLLLLILFFSSSSGAHANENLISITQKIKGNQYLVSLKNNSPETQIITEIEIEIKDKFNVSGFHKSFAYSIAINPTQSIDFPIIKTSELREALQIDPNDFPYLCHKFTSTECRINKTNTSSLIKPIGLAVSFTSTSNIHTKQLRGLNIIYKTHGD